MCGIFGYFSTIANQDIIKILIKGLYNLEYRGYDSAGIAMLDINLNVYSYKSQGKVSRLDALLETQLHNNFIPAGIAHTRWATNGPPTENNSHPHHSDEFWVVHNGIINNEEELKKLLTRNGYSFYSDTDTEIIPKLISYHKSMGKTLVDAITDTLQSIEGTYAVLILQKNVDQIIGAKNGSPLVVGLDDTSQTFVFSSEISPVVEHTRKILTLEDNQLILINQSGIDLFIDMVTRENVDIQKQVETTVLTKESASKGGYDHFMLKEIHEQSKAIKDTMGPQNDTYYRLNSEFGNVNLGGLKEADQKLREINRIVLLGVGTSYNACQLGKLYFERITRIPCSAEESPDYHLNDPIIDSSTLAICISQSGETKDTVNALEEVKTKGGFALGITNRVDSQISKLTDAGVYNHIGPEISVASTKAFTSQCLLLLMFAIYFGRQRDLGKDEGQDLIESLKELPALVEQTLQLEDQIKSLAQKYANQKHMFVIGRKYNAPIAMEAALKIKEVTYIKAEGYNAGVLKHGPIALIEPGFLTLALAPKDSIFDGMTNSMKQITARGGSIIAITSEDAPVIEHAQDVIRIPKTREKLYPFLLTPVYQLFAYHLAVCKGLDPDKPRNLAKSVTVE
jgi:glutamine---fructose-6-phosphate transaminase (isomerizing)